MDARQERRVHRLRLRCEAPAQVAQLSHVSDRIGDALRCASLPGAPDRVLLVRRLDLGRLPATDNPMALVLHLQAAVQRAGWSWVCGDTAHAARAPAVWFSHVAHAVGTAWAWRNAGRALDAWYWPHALPGVALRGDLPALRNALRGLIEWQVGVGAAQAWWPEPPASSVESVAHATWQQRDTRPLQAWQGLVDAGAVSVGASAMTVDAAERAAHPPMIVPASDSVAHPQSDAKLPAFSGHPERVGPVARLTPDVSRDLEPPAMNPYRDAKGPEKRLDDQLGLHKGFLFTAASVRQDAQPLPRAVQEACAKELVGAGEDQGTGMPKALADFTRADSRAWLARVPTGMGGLLLLLPALQRLSLCGYPRDAQDFAALSLVALSRLRPDPEDAVHQLIAGLAGGHSLDSRRVLALAVWRTLRVWLRREAGIGPAHLLVRRAGLRWDATHIDLHFALNDADLRIRRAGLDQSPGWLPWLGRVVSVHFDAPGASR